MYSRSVPKSARLVLLSFLMLFVELALIRWTGSNIIYLSYFSNFVLLGSFLGIGIGFLRCRSRFPLFRFAPVALALLVFLVLRFPVSVDRTGSELIYFGEFRRTGLPIWLTLPVVFVCSAAVMALIAEEVGRAFAEFDPLTAYRLDIIGSILGISAFSLLSFLQLPPIAWGLVVAAGFLLLLPRPVGIAAILPLTVLVASLAWESFPQNSAVSTSWSPYYKIQVQKVQFGHGLRQFDVAVNGIPHQAISSVAERRRTNPLYFAPYARFAHRRPGDVLIIGAGTGTDVAIALAHGARRVDAVEIDPRLYQLGKQLQQNHAYQDRRVFVHITDGRAFLENTHRKYDLILFALPDSLTLVSGQSSLRLESYLFTLESINSAKAHLKSGGAFAMYNWYRARWLVDRLANTLAVSFGHPPCLDTNGGRGHFAVLSDGNVKCAVRWTPGHRVIPPPAHDDYPFLYLRTRTIPSLYLITLALILAAALVGVRAVGGPFRAMAGFADLFFMGAAFLLLETKNVVQFALLFGTTWFVNALVFGGILVVVLAAVEAARRLPQIRPAALYCTLFATLALAWAIPPDKLLSLSWQLRLPAAIALAFAPVFCANVIFAARFKSVASSTVAFGANLIGAMVGGVLEYVSLITGYRALLLVIAGLYACAFVADRRRRTAESSAGRVEARPTPSPALELAADGHAIAE
jgi:SAM-dependent methyltransferase